MSEADMNAALDALENEHGVDLDVSPEPEVIEEAAKIVEELEPEPEVIDEKPPGYMGYDDWIAAGKNPDDFKGKNAYSAEYGRIQEVKELKGLVEKVVDTTGQWKKQQQADTQRQIEQAVSNAKAELEQAKDDHDIDAALAAQDKLKSLEAPQQPQATAQQTNPAITDFFAKNPILDESSAQYDAEVFQDAKMVQHKFINDLTGGDPELIAQLTPQQMQRSMAVAFRKAKELNPDKFRSARNTRQAAPAGARRSAPKAEDYGTRLKATKFESKHNKRDNNAASDMYETLKQLDPVAAESFAKKVLGE